MTSKRPYDALLFDLDGTLLGEDSRVRPRNKEMLQALEREGVLCLIATGRSLISTRPVIEELGLESPAVVFNGAAIWCPKKQRFLEEQTLADSTVERALEFAGGRDLMTVVMRTDSKVGTAPRNSAEEACIRAFHGLQIVERPELRLDYSIRVTIFSEEHQDSRVLCDEVERAIDRPMYLTHFPLDHLPGFRDSRVVVCDVQPPCKGKGEAVRFLEDQYGIPPERVLAFGDASNDVPMFEAAGMSVAMSDGMPEALEAAQEIIGDNDTDAIAEYLERVFEITPAK